MKRIILSAVALFLLIGVTTAQTRIKTNAAYWAILAPNIAVEKKIADHFTVEGQTGFAYWNSLMDKKPFKWAQLLGGVRYYPKKEFEGFYVGNYASGNAFIISKYNYGPDKVQHGYGISLGATIGYQFEISKRWNLDCYFGGGWHHAWYWGEDRKTGEKYIGWNRSGEWMPYRIGISFSYLIK